MTREEQTGRNDVEDLDKEHTFATWSRQRDFSPTEVVDTDGFRFITVNGNDYLDFSSQLVCTNLGYDAKRVKDAICEMVDQIPYIQPSYATRPRAELAAKLEEITPGTLTKTFFSTSGTEANEAAIKIARAYTGKEKIMSRYRSYHGATAASLSASGDPRRTAVSSTVQPEMPGMVKAPDTYAYGSSLNPEEGLEYIDEMLMLEGDTVAAIIVEPLVGSNGVLTPPDDYLPRLKRIAHDHGALLICDEVMTGFGRTGEWFGADLFDVEPDIMTTAKGLTSAYQPLAATTVNKKIADYFEENLLNHGHTFSGHPVACAAGLAAIETYKEENLIENAQQVGEYLDQELDSIADRHPSVGEHRGIGLHHGIELTRDPEKSDPFEERIDKVSSRTTVVDEVSQRAYENGVFFYTSNNTIIITPPLGISELHVNEAIDALDDALMISDSKMNV